MNYRFYYFAVVFFLCGGISASGESTVPEDLYRTVSEHVLYCRYREAEEILNDFIREHPNEPAGPLFKASLLQYIFIDYEDASREDEFYELLDTAEQLAREQRISDDGNLWADYYRFAADGLRGTRASLSGRLLYGITKGRSGARGMSEIVKEDPEFYDAYLLIGSYHFWRSVATARFAWLPFIGDEREKGLEEVTQAIGKGRLNGPISNTVLLEMLLEYEPERAMQLAEELITRYPSCRLFSWQLGEAYKKLERYDEAVSVFIGIAESMRADEVDDGSGELRCWWKLAVLSKSMGKTEEMIFYCNKIFDLGKRGSVSIRQKDRIDGAREMLEELRND